MSPSVPVENILTLDGKTEKACRKAPLVIEIDVLPGGKPFLRADASNDGRVNLADAVRIVGELYFEGPPLVCRAAADANGDVSLDASDVVYLLGYLFLSGRPIPAPFPACGPDPVPENPLSCDADAVRCR